MHEISMRLRDLPSWYRVSFIDDPIGIRIAAHPAAAASLLVQGVYEHGWYWTTEEAMATELPTFIPPSINAPWGFGPLLQPGTDTDGWPCWTCAFPRVGFDDPNPDWKTAIALASSLAELFHGLNAVDVPIEGSRPQAYTVSTHVRLNAMAYGAPISATVSGWWAARIADRFADPACEHEAIRLITQTIHHAYAMMHGGDVTSLLLWERAFHFTNPDKVFFIAPGNACGLGYDYGNARSYPSGGYELSPHNTDHPVQQLSLLAGLARLSSYLGQKH